MRKFTTVTQEGITSSQPGTHVSVCCPAGYETEELRNSVRLNVFRVYDLPNEFGGVGVHKHLDAHDKLFPTRDDAWKYCLEHGYIRKYYTSPDLRQHHLDEGFNPKTKQYTGPKPPTWWTNKQRGES